MSEDFNRKIESIACLEQLHRLKQSIKDEVVNPRLRWDERMLLYERVRLINERVAYLSRSNRAKSV